MRSRSGKDAPLSVLRGKARAAAKEITKSNEQVMEEFDEVVNMSPKELGEWLETEESKEVGQKDGGSESKGHESGRKIVEILGKERSHYTDEDIDHMRRVVTTSTATRPRSPKATLRTLTGATP